MRVLIYLLCAFCLVACQQAGPSEKPAEEKDTEEKLTNIEDYPLIPMSMFEEQGDVLLLRAAIPTYDRHYASAAYHADGEIYKRQLETHLFPTDVYAIYRDGMESPWVFLARTPNVGCILTYDVEINAFNDPCSGSVFEPDGTYVFGPSQRNLDKLPSEVKDGMLWIRNEIIYGEPATIQR